MSTGGHTNGPAPIIRPMMASDIPAALRLWKKTAGVEISEGDHPAELAAYLQRNPLASQVMVNGNELIGAVLAGSDGRRGFIYHLAIAPKHRGAGLGSALVLRSLEGLKAQKLKRVLVFVATDNPRGRRFWKKNGWEFMEFAQMMGKDL